MISFRNIIKERKKTKRGSWKFDLFSFLGFLIPISSGVIFTMWFNSESARIWEIYSRDKEKVSRRMRIYINFNATIMHKVTLIYDKSRLLMLFSKGIYIYITKSWKLFSKMTLSFPFIIKKKEKFISKLN